MHLFYVFNKTTKKTFNTAVPASPTSLNFTVVDNTVASQWDEVVGVDNYRVTLTFAATSEEVESTSTFRGMPTYTFENLLYGTEYVVTVCAVNSAGERCISENFETGKFQYWLLIFACNILLTS